MSSLLHRIAAFSARRRLLVIGVWLLLLVGLGMASHAAGTKYSSSAEVAGSDRAAANELPAPRLAPGSTESLVAAADPA